jgi:hypothetical protein
MRLLAPRSDDRHGLVRLEALDLHQRGTGDPSDLMGDRREHLGWGHAAGDETGESAQRILLAAWQIRGR